MRGDVLAEDEGGLDLLDESSDGGPEVPRVFGTKPPPSQAERLARVARTDNIHDTTPRVTVEGVQISPDRYRIQGTLPHRRDHVCDGECFPLHVTDRAATWENLSESALEAETPGT